MRTAVHPDRPVLHVGAQVFLVGDDFLCGRILFFPDPELQRPTVEMRSIVRLTLVFQKRNAGNIEALGIPAGSVVHRYSSEVALHVTGNSVSLILVVPAGPFPGQANLSRCRSTYEHDQEQTT